MSGTPIAGHRGMRIEEIAEQSRLAEGAYYAAARQGSHDTRRLKRIADSWEGALVAAVLAREALEQAQASGNPADGAGIPD